MAQSSDQVSIGRLMSFGVEIMVLWAVVFGTLFGALYAAMTPTANGEPPAQYAAWRPDGQVLAAIAEPHYGVAPEAADDLLYHPTVVLYDTASGHKLTTLKPKTQLGQQMSGSFTSQSLWLRWSPDGTRLLLLDESIGTLTIWGPGALPK